ncbi:MAG: methionyl-tRNA formyltransferase [Paracoccus denitrificans]|uniref:Methionyl-tRNA formyltransferase n=1 Tax=Paracoccus denitrificans TaxID=266 RepID=A0A533IAG5_PARDE|nr:MAG: methionyl-tRNA formyltransferase [Paracoccus denitrificans]
MKAVFIGAVEGSAKALGAICDAGHAPDLVVSLPLEKAANHSDFFDLGPIAESRGIPILRVARSDDSALMATLRDMAPDLIMIIGWSQLVGPEMLALPRIGVLGFHPAPLPKMRGRAVIPWQILTGQEQGGATLFWVAEGVDDGDIAAQSVFDIDPATIDARGLYDRAVDEIVRLLPALLTDLAAGKRPAQSQDDSRATICARRRPEDGEIDWSRPATEIERLIRAVGPPYPGASTRDAKGAVLTITSARIDARVGRYIGLPGQVQDIDGRNITVMCGDGCCVELTGWSGPERLARHSILGKN